MSISHEMAEEQAKQNAKNVPGKYVDPVLGNWQVDNVPGGVPRLRQSRVQLGTVPQKNHKVIGNR